MCCVTATRTVNLFLITLGLMHTEVLVEDIILSSSLVFLSPLSLDLGFSPVTLLSKTKFSMLLFLPWLNWLLRYVDASYKFLLSPVRFISTVCTFGSYKFHLCTLPFPPELSGTSWRRKASLRGLECSTTGRIVTIKSNLIFSLTMIIG